MTQPLAAQGRLRAARGTVPRGNVVAWIGKVQFWGRRKMHSVFPPPQSGCCHRVQAPHGLVLQSSADGRCSIRFLRPGPRCYPEMITQRPVSRRMNPARMPTACTGEIYPPVPLRLRRNDCGAMHIDNRGFTLIELLVVMLLLVIVLAMVGLGLGSSESREVQNEADRMALLLQSARQESILQGKVFAVAFAAGSYQFLVLNNQTGKFEAIKTDDMLRVRKLPAAITIRSVDVDGTPGGSKPRLILLPTGELPTFSIDLAHGDNSWRVEGTPDGEIKTARPHA